MSVLRLYNLKNHCDGFYIVFHIVCCNKNIQKHMQMQPRPQHYVILLQSDEKKPNHKQHLIQYGVNDLDKNTQN